MSIPSSIDRIQALRRIAETFALAAVGGLALGLTGVPGGYLSGSILAVACAALAGWPLAMPLALTRAILVLIGTSLGAVVTPDTINGMAAYPLSIGLVIVAMVCVSAGGTAYLRAIHGWSKADAFLASAPGAMSQVLAMGAEVGADLRAIAIVQSVRVVIVTVGVPAGLSLFGLAGHAMRPPVAPLTFGMLDELAILVAVSSLGAAAAHWLRVPGGLLFGAMIISAALHGSGLIHAALPVWVVNAAAIALGAVIGARFINLPPRMLLRFLGAAFGSFAVSVSIATVFGAVVIGILALKPAEVIIAYAPGAVDAMMLLALALHLDPVYVGAHHVVRILFVSMSMPLVARRAARKAKK